MFRRFLQLFCNSWSCVSSFYQSPLLPLIRCTLAHSHTLVYCRSSIFRLTAGRCFLNALSPDEACILAFALAGVPGLCSSAPRENGQRVVRSVPSGDQSSSSQSSSNFSSLLL
ncbi:hypothetical protein HETIRDRAFT_442298, partial [Heterobasidion irregulare TC 32-1]